METGPRDSLRVESKLKGARKIHIGDGREASNLDLPASMSAGDVPFMLRLGSSPGTRADS